MIDRQQVMDLLVASCPSYRPGWETQRLAPDFDAALYVGADIK
jgi:hypothetical protein